MAQANKKNRSLARLLAAQTLFAIEATRSSYKEALAQILNKELSELLDSDDEATELDATHLQTVVTEAVTHQSQIDKAVNGVLKEGWPLKSIDPTLRAIFRAASAELLLKRVPAKVVINEYIEVSKAFDDRRETTSFVNAVLDKASKVLLEAI